VEISSDQRRPAYLEQQPLEQQLFDCEELATSAGVALTEQLLAASQQQPRISQTIAATAVIATFATSRCRIGTSNGNGRVWAHDLNHEALHPKVNFVVIRRA
jgi:hypothetical protein